MLRVVLKVRQPFLDDVVCYSLHGLSGDAKAPCCLRDRKRTLRDNAHQLPTCWGLAFGCSHGLAESSECPSSLTAMDNLKAAQRNAMVNRPTVGGFPVLAETLRRAGVHLNIWSLPSTQSVYLTDDGAVVDQGPPLIIVRVRLRCTYCHGLRN
jgi:hypothetical protein